MKVLIVCEDPTHDQYIVKPVVTRLFEDLPRRAQIEVLRDPHLRGIDDLLAELPEIVRDNRMIDLFVVIADRDCERQKNSDRLGRAASVDPRVVWCCAIEEVEAWMLALHRAELNWPAVRADCDVKEHYALPFLKSRGFGGLGQGRKRAMVGLGQSWRGLLQVCDEIVALGAKIKAGL